MSGHSYPSTFLFFISIVVYNHAIVYMHVYPYSQVIESTFSKAKTISVIVVDLLNCSVKVSIKLCLEGGGHVKFPRAQF